MNVGLELQHGKWTRDNRLSATDSEDALRGKRRLSQAMSKHFLQASLSAALGYVMGIGYGVLTDDAEHIFNSTDAFLLGGGTAITSFVIAKLFVFYFSVHEERAVKVVDYLGKRTERN